VFVTQRGALAADGVYILPNDGAFTVDSGAPAPSSGTRWDLIWVRQKNAYGSDGFGDANSDPDAGVVVGTAGSTPTKPYSSVPSGALVIAESRVGTSIPNATTATITQVAAQKDSLLGPVYETGDTAVTIAAGDNQEDQPVVFAKNWAVPPNVQVTVVSAAGRFAAYILGGSKTTAGFTLRAYQFAGTNLGSAATVTVSWLAIAPTS
jgi:hypothetical protein